MPTVLPSILLIGFSSSNEREELLAEEGDPLAALPSSRDKSPGQQFATVMLPMIILGTVSSQRKDLVQILNFNSVKYILQLAPSITKVRTKCMLILLSTNR